MSDAGAAHARVRPDPEAHGTGPTAHLTTIDAIVLPLLLVDDSRPSGAPLETLHRVSVTAGTAPWVDLDRVPVSVRSVPDDGGRTVHARVGSFRTQLRLAPSGENAGGPGVPTVYACAYRDIEVRTRLTSVTGDAVLGAHAADFASAPLRVSGTDASGWPRWSAITYLAIMGQLTQVALLAATGRGRRETGNLWMRRMSIDLSGREHPRPGPVLTETRVTDRHAAFRGDPGLQVGEVRSTASDGVVAEASLAYRVQTS